jgi:hypothetical protein
MPDNPKIKLRTNESAGAIDCLEWHGTAIPEVEIIFRGVMKCLAVVDTSLVVIDVIEYRNKLWLVPEWLDSSDDRWCAPRRIIYAGKLRRCHFTAAVTGTDFALDETLTEDVLDCTRTSPNAAKYQIIDLPALRVRKLQLH